MIKLLNIVVYSLIASFLGNLAYEILNSSINPLNIAGFIIGTFLAALSLSTVYQIIKEIWK